VVPSDRTLANSYRLSIVNMFPSAAGVLAAIFNKNL